MIDNIEIPWKIGGRGNSNRRYELQGNKDKRYF